MASARFQVVSLPRDAVSDAPAGNKEADSVGSGRRFVWRFLAANNRSLATASDVYPDVESCLRAVTDVKQGVQSVDPQFTREADGKWQWTIPVKDGAARSTHSYRRQVRARLTCATFLELVAEPGVIVQVVYR